MAGLFSRTWANMNRPATKPDPKVEASRMLMDEGVRPSSLRTSESEPVSDVVAKWNAAVEARAQEIKKSRDPKLQREQQLQQRTANISKADEALKKVGVSPEDFWTSEPGMAVTSFKDRTGKDIAIPAEAQVGGMAREVATPTGGLVRQFAGSQGYGSTALTPEQADALAKQRGAEEERASLYQSALAKAKETGTRRAQERAQEHGQEIAAKFAQWDADKRAYEEGKQAQRDAGMRISRINRALREQGRFRQKWEGGPKEVLTAQQYNDLLDERGQLQNIVNTREGLRDKGITNLGRKIEDTRKQRLAESERLRQAYLTQAERANIAAGEAQTGMQMVPYYSNILQNVGGTYFGNIANGFGVASLPYSGIPVVPSIPSTKAGTKTK